MNVLSLFDGMSCGQIALDQLGVKVDNYYASEIDKYAIKVTQKNYPNTKQIGSVTEVKGKDLPKIDLIICGSPCQGFSFAGKQLNFNDPRSALFFQFVRLLRECKPKYFLLENVRMKKEYQEIISEHLGVEPVMINSTLVSAQNRVRLYWTNIPGLIQPEDKGLVLKDIIEDGVSDILSDKEMAYMLRSENTNKHTPRINRARSENQKSNTLTNSMYKGVPHGVIQRPITQPKDKGIVLKDILEDVVNDEYNAGQHLLDGYKGGDQLNPNYKSQANTIHRDKTATLCAGTHGYSNGYVERPCELKEFNQDSTCHHAATATDIKGNELIKRVYAKTGKSPTLNACTGGNREPKVLNDNVVVTHPTYRKLTPLECERLQTVPDGYTSGVSNTQRYKLLGNGFTVDVIKHILQEMIQ